MKVTKFMKWLLPLSLVVGLLSCEETSELEILVSPNALAPEQADVDFFLNSIQLILPEFLDGSTSDNFEQANEVGMELTRMQHMFGPSYTNAYDPGSLNEIWEDAYADILIDIRTMSPLAEEAGLYTHLAIGQVIEAYVIMTLVDMFGEIPYSEALQGGENFNPNVDDGASVYAAAEQLLDQAIENLNREETSLPDNDLYYGGDESQWIKLANTLKLKLYLQTRLVDSGAGAKIQALVDGGNIITDMAEDFKFDWSQTDANPDSRHPIFADSYGTGSGPDDYMSNWYMNLLLNGQATPDPRIRYYFYRQVLDYDDADQITKECVLQQKPSHYSDDDAYCLIGSSGYWGRNHGDDDGIPPDDQFRTLWGVYPVGGPFDDNSAEVAYTERDAGLAGAGITPIMMSFYVDFMLAEAGLTLGVGDGRAALESGMRKSIATVMEFGNSLANEDSVSRSYIPTEADIQTYIDGVLAEYDAGDQTGKLNVIATQYLIALWGNGVEAYNTYRRTGQPTDIEPTLLANPGEYLRTLPYPARVADFNSSISQKSITSPPAVFWDTNPGGFVD